MTSRSSDPGGRLREAQIQRQILDYFAGMGIPALRVNSGRAWVGHRRIVKFGDQGFPDILAWPGRGVTLAIEVKRQGEKLSPAQAEWALLLKMKGIHHMVARSVEEVVVRINAMREAA